MQVLNDEGSEVPWKKETRLPETTCNWGPCHGCEVCKLMVPPSPPPPPPPKGCGKYAAPTCTDNKHELCVYDEACASPSTDRFEGSGCNAGGIKQTCRFCGFRNAEGVTFPECVNGVAPPPAQPPPMPAFLLHEEQGCGTKGARLGMLKSPAACLDAARETEGCGDAIQWSQKYNFAWGCHCCAPGGKHSGKYNKEWEVWSNSEIDPPAPPSPPPELNAVLLAEKRECKLQASNLGVKMATVTDCLIAAKRRDVCKGMVMWSEEFNSKWGCRCCDADGADAGSENEDWAVWGEAEVVGETLMEKGSALLTNMTDNTTDNVTNSSDAGVVAELAVSEEGAKCMPFCTRPKMAARSWEDKCSWPDCGGCDACSELRPKQQRQQQQQQQQATAAPLLVASQQAVPEVVVASQQAVPVPAVPQHQQAPLALQPEQPPVSQQELAAVAAMQRDAEQQRQQQQQQQAEQPPPQQQSLLPLDAPQQQQPAVLPQATQAREQQAVVIAAPLPATAAAMPVPAMAASMAAVNATNATTNATINATTNATTNTTDNATDPTGAVVVAAVVAPQQQQQLPAAAPAVLDDGTVAEVVAAPLAADASPVVAVSAAQQQERSSDAAQLVGKSSAVATEQKSEKRGLMGWLAAAHARFSTRRAANLVQRGGEQSSGARQGRRDRTPHDVASEGMIYAGVW